MVGSSNTLRKIGGKLAVNTCYVLTADVSIDSFVFKRSISRKLLIIVNISVSSKHYFKLTRGPNIPQAFAFSVHWFLCSVISNLIMRCTFCSEVNVVCRKASLELMYLLFMNIICLIS